MGNYNFKVTNIPKPGSIVTIVHDDFSRYQEIPDNILRANEKVKVINTKNLYQSNPNCENISVTTVQFADKTTEVYLTKNIR